MSSHPGEVENPGVAQFVGLRRPSLVLKTGRIPGEPLVLTRLLTWRSWLYYRGRNAAAPGWMNLPVRVKGVRTSLSSTSLPLGRHWKVPPGFRMGFFTSIIWPRKPRTVTYLLVNSRSVWWSELTITCTTLNKWGRKRTGFSQQLIQSLLHHLCMIFFLKKKTFKMRIEKRYLILIKDIYQKPIANIQQNGIRT